MAGGVAISSTGGGGPELGGKMNVYVILCCVIASTGGLMFGYDIGISGGVSAMDDFLKKFFHSVYLKKHEVHEDNYCKYDNQGLQLFTSSLYLAALLASFVASRVCSLCGRKFTMQIASVVFLGGVVLNGFAAKLSMLIIGRLLLGFGIGFANQAVPLFISEIAPVKYRGGLNILFQLMVTIGILIANLVNYFMERVHPWGWRVSLGLAGVPALLLLLGSFVIPETPTSLIERSNEKQGHATLKKIRGTENVDTEYWEIMHACEVARQVKNPFSTLLKRKSRPQLVIAILMQVFQQFTGINAIMFYAPVLFQTIGFHNNASLMSSVITGIVNVGSTVVSILVVDRFGRKILLQQACGQMLATQVAIGGILMVCLKSTGGMTKVLSIVVVILVCAYVMSFAWSWGPLGWLIPSETFPVETRTAGYAFAVSSNMLFTFLIAQSFLSMLCRMKAGVFFFFAAWIVVMSIFTTWFLPETKGISIDEMTEVWKQHWYWKRFMEKEGDGHPHSAAV